MGLEPAIIAAIIAAGGSLGAGALGGAFGGQQQQREPYTNGADPNEWLTQLRSSLETTLKSATDRANEPVDLTQLWPSTNFPEFNNNPNLPFPIRVRPMIQRPDSLLIRPGANMPNPWDRAVQGGGPPISSPPRSEDPPDVQNPDVPLYSSSPSAPSPLAPPSSSPDAAVPEGPQRNTSADTPSWLSPAANYRATNINPMPADSMAPQRRSNTQQPDIPKTPQTASAAQMLLGLLLRGPQQPGQPGQQDTAYA